MRKSPLRKIVQAIARENAAILTYKAKVLEVGCGSNNYNKQLVEGVEALWIGLDISKVSIATHFGSVSSMPFEDNYFDFIISSQTIEHWYEYSTTFSEGIIEIIRVLKPSGLLLLDYPICLHGHPYFMLDKREKIHSLFDGKSWKKLEINQYYPEIPYYTWTGTRNKIADQYFMEIILKRYKKPAYIERMVLKKTVSTVIKPGNRQMLSDSCNKLLYSALRVYKVCRMIMNQFAILFTKRSQGKNYK